MKLSRFALILMAGGLILPGALSAQVAAPSIFPNEFVTRNPAAMQWGAPSRIGIVRAELESKDPIGGGTGTGEFNLVGFRGVGEVFSLAAEAVRSESEFGTRKTEFDAARGALGVAVLDWLAVGALYEESTFKETQPGFEFEIDQKSVYYGVSAKIGEFLFVGYAQGMDEFDGAVRVTAPIVATAVISDEREGRTFGVGIRAGSDLRIHAEAFRTEFDPWVVTADGTFLTQDAEFGETNENAAVVEVGWGNWLIGIATFEREDLSDDEDTSRIEFAIGWSDMEGIGIVYNYGEAETKDAGGTVIDESKFQALSIVYQF